MNILSNATDKAASVFTSVPGVSSVAYAAFLGAMDENGMKVAQFVSICFTSVFTDESNAKIDAFIKNNEPFSKLYEKFKIMKKIMKSETMTLEDFLKKNRVSIKPWLDKLHVNSTSSRLKDDINAHVQDILNLLDDHSEEISNFMKQAKLSGGKRTKRKRTKRRTKRKRL
jgi:hypothetical protein